MKCSRESDESNVVLGGGYNCYDGDHFGKVLLVKDAIPQEIKPEHEYYRNNATKADFNIYVKIDQKIGEVFSFYADMQYRRVDYNFLGIDDTGVALPSNDNHNFFLPKVGLSVSIYENSSAFVSYSRGAREPNRSDYTETLLSTLPS